MAKLINNMQINCNSDSDSDSDRYRYVDMSNVSIPYQATVKVLVINTIPVHNTDV